MTLALNSSPVRLDLTRKRGDTFAWQFTLRNANGVVIDITGFSFKLTVNSEKAPTNTDNQVFQVNGVLDDATNGVVSFPISSQNADQTPAIYYYDIQWTDVAGSVRTILEGTWEVLQDITK